MSKALKKNIEKFTKMSPTMQILTGAFLIIVLYFAFKLVQEYWWIFLLGLGGYVVYKFIK